MALLSFTGSPHGGRQRHLPEWQSQPRIKPTTIIDHSIVGTGEQGFQHFLNRSVLESHFIVCGAGDVVDGEIWQLMDTDRQADANLDANDYAISIETGDLGDPDNQPWTGEQMDSMIWLHEKLRAVHPTIPRRKSRSCADPAGLGYHTLHGAPSCWTPVAKSCPGRVRKAQWVGVLLPAFLTPEEDDMTPAEHDALMWLRKNAVLLRDEGVRMTAMGDPEGPSGRMTNNLAEVLARLDAIEAQLGPVAQGVDALVASHPDPLTEPPPEPPPVP